MEGYVGGETGDRVSGGTDGSGKWRDMSVERPVIGLVEELMGRVSGMTDGSGKWRDMSVERPVIGLVEGLMGRVSGGICRWRDRR